MEPRHFGPNNFTRPFAEQLGAQVLSPGVVHMERDPYVPSQIGMRRLGLGSSSASSVE